MLRIVLVSLLAIAAGVMGFLLARGMPSTVPAKATAMVAAPPQVIGRAAPALVLRDLNGHGIDLSALAGRSVVLNFWASWCGPCIEEMPLLDAIHRDAGAGPFVIGVALDEESAVRRFLALHPVRYPIGIGVNGVPDTSVAFGNDRDVLPYSVLIDADGVIRKTRFGSFTASDLQDWIQP